MRCLIAVQGNYFFRFATKEHTTGHIYARISVQPVPHGRLIEVIHQNANGTPAQARINMAQAKHHQVVMFNRIIAKAAIIVFIQKL